jgi:hypothetical protein
MSTFPNICEKLTFNQPEKNQDYARELAWNFPARSKKSQILDKAMPLPVSRNARTSQFWDPPSRAREKQVERNSYVQP